MKKVCSFLFSQQVQSIGGLNTILLGKEKLLAIGVYPDVSLASARNKRDEARKLIASDTDPSVAKKTAKRATKESAENSFEAIAREWFIRHSVKWVESHREDVIRRLERDIFPWMHITAQI